MAGDPSLETDDQDQAEMFDETNITRDGEAIANPDLAKDVLDVTSAQGDGLEGEDGDLDDVEDFDPDQADEAELEFMLESDDRFDEPRSFARDDTDLVASDDDQPADFEPEDLTGEALEDIGFLAEENLADSRARRERRLDEGLEETFLASDPLSTNPGAD